MPAVLYAATDDLKLVLFVLVAIGLLMLGRWSSRLGPTYTGDSPANQPTPDSEDLLPDAGEDDSHSQPASAEETAASLPFDPSLGELRITKFFFKATEAAPGPPDPEVFADELQIELYDPDSGHTWWQSYFVATPKGLAKILKDKSWRYLHAPQILVLPRYDLEEIRRAAVSRIKIDHDYFKGRETEDAEEESL
jgi:hypothetical protein